MKRLKRFLAIVLIGTMAINMIACGEIKKDNKDNKEEITLNKYQDIYYDYFDTVSVVIGYEENEDDFKETSDYIKEELKKYNMYYDIYHHYDGITNIMDLNNHAAEGPVKVDKEIIDLLKLGKEVYDITDGNTNIAFGAVLSIWHKYRNMGIDDPANAKLPPMKELKKAAKHCDINDVVIDEENMTVFFKDPKLRLDVGALAKGYATELVCKELMNKGVDKYILSIGGNVRSIGTKGDGSKWVAGIQNPDTESEELYIQQVEVKNQALVTSGSYQRYYYVGQEKYHHIINKDTLMPNNEWVSVSVLNKDSGMGDALSTALFNMSLEDGKALIESIDDTEAMWIDAKGNMEYSSGYEQYIVK